MHKALVEKAKTVLTSGDFLANPFALRKKPNYILSEESANDQVLDLLEYYDIDVERLPKNNGINQVETALKVLVEYVRRGSVEIGRDKDQKIKITLTLSRGDTAIEFGELGAKHKLVMDRVKGGENYGRIYALMGSLSGLGSAAIEKLPARDLAVVEILGMVFLSA